MAIVAHRHLKWEPVDGDGWELKWLTDGTVMRRNGNFWREIPRKEATLMVRKAMSITEGNFREFPTPAAGIPGDFTPKTEADGFKI